MSKDDERTILDIFQKKKQKELQRNSFGIFEEKIFLREMVHFSKEQD